MLKTVAELKEKFLSLSKPTESDYHDLLESFIHKSELIGFSSMSQDVIDEINSKASLPALLVYIPVAEKGAANGVAPLGANGKISQAYMPFPARLFTSLVGNVVQNGVSTDVDALTLQIPTNELAVGEVIEFMLSGHAGKATGAQNLELWIKVNGYKSNKGVHDMGTAALSSQPFSMRGSLVVKQLGPASGLTPGSIQFSAQTYFIDGTINVVNQTFVVNTGGQIDITLGVSTDVASGSALNVMGGWLLRI